jgi:hypothetical protein
MYTVFTAALLVACIYAAPPAIAIAQNAQDFTGVERGLKGVERSVREQTRAAKRHADASVRRQAQAAKSQEDLMRTLAERDDGLALPELIGAAVAALSAIVALFALVAARRSAVAAKEQADAARDQATEMSEQSTTLAGELAAAQQGLANARAQLALGMKSYRSTLRPMLLDVPEGLIFQKKTNAAGVTTTQDLSEVKIDANSVSTVLTLPVRNVGAGPAEMTAARLDLGTKKIVGRSLMRVLPPTEVAPVRVDVPDADVHALHAGPFRLEVDYADIEGVSQPTAVLEFVWINNIVIVAPA